MTTLLAAALLAAQTATLQAQANGYSFHLVVGPPDRILAAGPSENVSVTAMLPPGGPGQGNGNPPRSMLARAARGGGGGPGKVSVGPVALLEPGKWTHSFKLHVTAEGKPADAEMARLVAVRTDTWDVSVLPLYRTGKAGEFASNGALPGKGPYKLVIRALTRTGQPVTAKLDYK